MFCAQCGQLVAEGMKFCPHCGAPVAPLSPSAAPLKSEEAPAGPAVLTDPEGGGAGPIAGGLIARVKAILLAPSARTAETWFFG